MSDEFLRIICIKKNELLNSGGEKLVFVWTGCRTIADVNTWFTGRFSHCYFVVGSLMYCSAFTL